MKKLLLAAAALVGLSSPAVGIEPGIYYCVTERMVGIQPNRRIAEGEDPSLIDRSWGRIEPNRGRFIVKIFNADVLDPDEACDQAIEDEKKSEELGVPLSFVENGDLMICSGLVRFIAHLPEEKKGLSPPGLLVSGNGRHFTDGGATVFWIGSDLKYQLTQLKGSFGNWLEEGHCEHF